MDWHSVNSSTLERIAYDASSMTLVVEFRSGTQYQYFGVPEYVFRELAGASSPGHYLAEQVKRAYRYSRL
jgi:hypothetical protein